MPCSDGGRESASPVSSACSRVSFEALSFPACPVRMDSSPDSFHCLTHLLIVSVDRSTNSAANSLPAPIDSMMIASDLSLMSLCGAPFLWSRRMRSSSLVS